MSFQLNGGENFYINRQLEDPLDTNTYYVRAYIRKASDDSLIDTVDLDDKGDQRFRKVWHVPNYTDHTWITITTRVYTDSGYTTESNLYAREEQTFLIQTRWSRAFGSGGGADVDYKRIKKLIKEEVENIKFPELPEPKIITKYNTVQEKIIVDLSPLTKQLKVISESIDIIRNKKDKDVNFTPVSNEIKALGDMLVKTIKVAPEADLTPILRAIDGISTSLSTEMGDIKKNTEKEEIVVDKRKEKLLKRRNVFLGKTQLNRI
uniref:Uncharacterized protein n=1 Tax=viral metagenome TaxID=1070528 RepID=A0A6H1ZGD8_9ZZZZ